MSVINFPLSDSIALLIQLCTMCASACFYCPPFLLAFFWCDDVICCEALDLYARTFEIAIYRSLIKIYVPAFTAVIATLATGASKCTDKYGFDNINIFHCFATHWLADKGLTATRISDCIHIDTQSNRSKSG